MNQASSGDTRPSEVSSARQLGLAILLGRRRDDDVLVHRLARRLADSDPRRTTQAA